MGSTCSVAQSPEPKSPAKKETPVGTPQCPSPARRPSAAHMDDGVEMVHVPTSPRSFDGSDSQTAPKRFVSVITEEDLAQLPLTVASSRPRKISVPELATENFEQSMETGGTTPSQSLSSRISPKNRANVSFVHSPDVVIPHHAGMPHDAQLAVPRWPDALQPLSVAGVLGGESLAEVVEEDEEEENTNSQC